MAMSDGLRCDRHWCDCGGFRDGHWPVMLTQCQYHPECPCGGHYPPHKEPIKS